MSNNKVLVGGVLLILTGICFGALGAHGIKPLVSKDELESFKTGVDYQIYHGLSLLILFLLINQLKINLTWSIRIMFSGILLFSGSIYLLSLKVPLGITSWAAFLGPVTPIGGILLISSWALVLLRFYQHIKKRD